MRPDALRWLDVRAPVRAFERLLSAMNLTTAEQRARCPTNAGASLMSPYA